TATGTCSRVVTKRQRWPWPRRRSWSSAAHTLHQATAALRRRAQLGQAIARRFLGQSGEHELGLRRRAALAASCCLRTAPCPVFVIRKSDDRLTHAAGLTRQSVETSSNTRPAAAERRRSGGRSAGTDRAAAPVIRPQSRAHPAEQHCLSINRSIRLASPRRQWLAGRCHRRWCFLQPPSAVHGVLHQLAGARKKWSGISKYFVACSLGKSLRECLLTAYERLMPRSISTNTPHGAASPKRTAWRCAASDRRSAQPTPIDGCGRWHGPMMPSSACASRHHGSAASW